MASIDFTDIMKDKTSYLTFKEIDKMLQHCFDSDKAKALRDYMLILTMVRTGRRISEVVGAKPYTRNVGLRPVDIRDDGLIEWDILKKRHIWRNPKHGRKISKERLEVLRLTKMPKRMLITVDDEYLGILTSYVETLPIGSYDRVFPITRQRADVIVKTVAKECKIYRSSPVHCHSFRHSLAIHMLQQNEHDPTMLIKVKEILAHSDINVTMAYTQFTQTDKKDALNKTWGVG